MDKLLTLGFWQRLWQESVQAAATGGLRIVVVLVLYWVARKAANRLIDSALTRLIARQGQANASDERANRLRTLQGLVRSLAGYALSFILVITVIGALGVNVAGIVTTAGVGGLAIGFGAQKLVKDVISGFFIVMEDQFAVGDYVTVGAATGTVVEMGMRVTRIRDDQGRLWFLSNGDISVVTNHSRFPVEAFVEIALPAKTDLDRARAVITKAGDALAREEAVHLQAPPRVLGVSAFDLAQTTLRVAVVADPRSLAAAQLRVRDAMREGLASAGLLTT
jgi:moderate conductance mechanosensitive channel